MSGERRRFAIENEASTLAETAVVLDIEPVSMEFEMRYKAFENLEIQDMKLAIVCTDIERVSTTFGIAGKGSVARRGVSDLIRCLWRRPLAKGKRSLT